MSRERPFSVWAERTPTIFLCQKVTVNTAEQGQIHSRQFHIDVSKPPALHVVSSETAFCFWALGKRGKSPPCENSHCCSCMKNTEKKNSGHKSPLISAAF
uniref:Uncharacterized protein n=1 Tax=Sphaerodactylus townsendi TaxID=933632 RepID=A0ACB8FXP4_9SAUR